MSAIAEQLDTDPHQPQRPRLAIVGNVHDNDPELGYTFIPSQFEEGCFSPEQLARFPLAFMRGVGNAAIELTRHYTGALASHDRSDSERRTIGVNGHERTVLVAEPDPNTGVPADEVVTDVLTPGLTEMDIGSAKLLLRAMARRNPDRRTVLLPTPGVSLGGQVLSIYQGLTRSLEKTADENLEVVARVIGDGRANLVGTSLGSDIAVIMAGLNLSANGEAQINALGVKLLAPAVAARNVPESERFRMGDASDEELIDEATDKFFKHMPGDTLRSMIRHPELAGECIAVLGAYALEPHKYAQRLAAITGNLRGAQEGVEWETIKQVAQSYTVHVLGGELDPLVQAQLDQWVAVKEIAPKTKIRILGKRGHTLTIDGPGTAEHIFQMEQEDLVAA